MKELTRRQVDRILEKSIKLGHMNCPDCGILGADIVISFPGYGRMGAKILCQHCKCETKMFKITDSFTDETGRLATPVTKSSLLRGIEKALKEWDKLHNEYEEKRKHQSEDAGE